MATTIAVHGNAVSFAEVPGDCEQVNGIGWTDIVGLRQGWGTTFRGKAGKFLWFHYTLMTMSLVNDITSALSRLSVLFDIAGRARVDSIHIWNHDDQRIFHQDDLRQTTDMVLTLSPAVPMGNDIGISVGVFFEEAANITFRGLIVETSPTTPLPPSLDATFSGTATLITSNGNAPGPFTQSINLPLNFSSDRRVVRLTGFTPIEVGPFPVEHPTEGHINVITTVSLINALPGSFDPSSGQLQMQITLEFRHRNADTGGSIFGADPSQADFNLTTGSSSSPGGGFHLTGLPMNTSTGALTVVGTSRFRSGFLGGSDCSLEVPGTINPIP
jgi:hypothetical protein